MKTILTTADLPATLQRKVKRVCNQEHMNQNRIQFIQRTPDYFAMLEADQWTGWGYYPNENEID